MAQHRAGKSIMIEPVGFLINKSKSAETKNPNPNIAINNAKIINFSNCSHRHMVARITVKGGIV